MRDGSVNAKQETNLLCFRHLSENRSLLGALYIKIINVQTITKTRLFKYTENFTTQK